LADHVEAREVIETALAMYLLESYDPRQFRSDAAFRTQLVRRLRGLTEANAGVWYDRSTGKTKRAYRELPPRSVACMADWLVTAFGVVGIYIARLERMDWVKEAEERKALHTALAGLR
jgi:hypothetical protein